MQSFVAYDGQAYPVRDGFNIWPDGWSAEEEARMLSAWRAEEPVKPPFPFDRYARAFEAWITGGLLNDRERLLLDAWTNRNNINRALAYTRRWRWDWRQAFETVCQIHGNRHERPCGCAFHLVFDHHKRGELTDADIIPIAAERLCPQHSLINSLDGQFWGSARDSAQAA